MLLDLSVINSKYICVTRILEVNFILFRETSNLLSVIVPYGVPNVA